MRFSFKYFFRKVWLAAAGIDYPQEISAKKQSNMRWLLMDGVGASACDSILNNYFGLFILAVGGTLSQIGLLNSLSSLSATFMLLPGAVLAERAISRKKVILITGGGITRLAYLLIALIPFAFKGPALIYLIIGLKIIADSSNNLSTPPWMAMVADIVPMNIRGRYFGARNAAIGLAGMITTFIAGQIITAIDAPVGYQVGIGMAFLFGLSATFCYSRIDEERGEINPPDMGIYRPKALLKTLRSDPFFTAFCVSQMIWNLSISLAGPFFNTYMVEVLGGTAAIIGTLTIISSITGMFGQRFFGSLMDKIGNRKVIIFTGLTIPILPFIWIVSKSPWDTVPMYIFSGILWAGWGLSTFNQVLELSPSAQRGLYSALYQISLTISSAIGSAFGGILAEKLGYHPLFAISGIGRFLSVIFFIFLLRIIQKRKKAKQPLISTIANK